MVCQFTFLIYPLLSHLHKEAGFSPCEFYTLTSLTSWATCNPKRKTNEQGGYKNKEGDRDGGVSKKEKNGREVQEKEKNNGRAEESEGKVQEEEADDEERIDEEYNINEGKERMDGEVRIKDEVLGKSINSSSKGKSQESKRDVAEKGKSDKDKREGAEDPHTSSTTADLNTEENTAREK